MTGFCYWKACSNQYVTALLFSFSFKLDSNGCAIHTGTDSNNNYILPTYDSQLEGNCRRSIDDFAKKIISDWVEAIAFNLDPITGLVKLSDIGKWIDIINTNERMKQDLN